MNKTCPLLQTSSKAKKKTILPFQTRPIQSPYSPPPSHNPYLPSSNPNP